MKKVMPEETTPGMPASPFYVITITWDAESGLLNLTADGMNPFEICAILEAAREDLWSCRPDTGLTLDGMTLEFIEDEEE